MIGNQKHTKDLNKQSMSYFFKQNNFMTATSPLWKLSIIFYFVWRPHPVVFTWVYSWFYSQGSLLTILEGSQDRTQVGYMQEEYLDCSIISLICLCLFLLLMDLKSPGQLCSAPPTWLPGPHSCTCNHAAQEFEPCCTTSLRDLPTS